MNLNEKYNELVRKLNSLEEKEEYHIFEEVSNNDQITMSDIEWMENHYEEVKIRYKELKLGIYSN